MELRQHYTLVHKKNGAEANGSGNGSAQNGEGSACNRKQKNKKEKDSVSKKAKLDEDDDDIVCLNYDIVEVKEGQSPAKKAKLAAATGGTTVTKPVTKEDSEPVCMDWSYLETQGAKRRVGPPMLGLRAFALLLVRPQIQLVKRAKTSTLIIWFPKLWMEEHQFMKRKSLQGYDQKTVADQNSQKDKK